MAIGGSVKGLSEIKAALVKVKQEQDKKKRKALTRIGVIVKGDSVKMTPVDTSNLRGSAYMDIESNDKVIVGYTAAYAPFVHEDLESRHVKGEAKFLEKAAKQNGQRILEELSKIGV